MYQQCKRCVLDSTASEFYETPDGCYFCDLALKNKPSYETFYTEVREPKGEYDVLLGLSGGVDSSYCLHLLKSFKYRVLTFSVDNGWNDPKADENIMKLVETLKVPFIRYPLDLDKFKKLQGAFMKAGQKNIEIPTDHVLMAVSYELADEYGIKTIISGGNWATESIMPKSWGYQPRDLTHIKSVYETMFKEKLTGIPTCGLLKWNWYKWVKGINVVNMLDTFQYNREHAIQVLHDTYGYDTYGEKHTENFFTKWFQNFYLFEKFGIDKRKAHLSSLILSGQMTREQAMIELQQRPVYPEFGIEKKVLAYPKREYTEFKTDEKLFEFISKVIKYARTQYEKTF